MEIILLIVLLLLLISIPTGIAYLLHRQLRKTKIKLVGVLCLVIVPIFTIYVVYRALYPDDDFYFEEYKTVTLLNTPKSAIILKKTATYPDFHGDYISVSMIRLSKSEYLNLYKTLIKDKQIDTLGQLVRSQEFIDVVGKNEKLIKHTFTRKITNKEQSHYSINFLNDNKTVIIYIINF